jgi:asparagine N-glycosylation enzyme membrane subunit Stt3
MAETIVEQGHRPQWDYMASWPTGEPVRHPPLYHYFLAYTYHIFRWTTNNNLLLWCNYSCVIPVILFVILAYMVGTSISDTKGGLFCALLFALVAFPVRRTVIGFADTDGFILIFSLLVTYFWIKSFSGTKENYTFVYAALCGFSIFLFELTWVGYWHILLLVTGASFISVAIQYVTKKKINFLITAAILLTFFIPHILYSTGGYQALILVLLASILLLTIYTKKWPQYVAFLVICVCVYFLYAEGFFKMPLSYLQLGESIIHENVIYPYIGPYISQRQEVTGSFLLRNFNITLFLAPVGIYALLKKQETNYNLIVFLVLYLVGGLAMMFSGVRFLLILSVPVLILSSIALSFLWDALVKNSPGRKVVSICFIALLFVPVYTTAEQANGAGSPVSSNWGDALQWINTNAPEDAVVIADWGYGYYIESIAKRKSIMNGAHYDIEWRLLKFGKMLETNTEDIAVKEVFGFETTEEVKNIREFPQGETGIGLMEKEMTGFAVENQDAYLVLDSRTAMVFDIISRWGTWDYITGQGDPIALYRGASAGTVLQPQWKQYLYDAGVHQIIVYRHEGEYHSFIFEKGALVPTEGTIYSDEESGEPYFLKRETGAYGVVWFSSESLIIFIPSDALDIMMVRLYFFNGEGLTHFELVADFGDVKVFKIHRESIPNLNEPVTVKIDKWHPG